MERIATTTDKKFALRSQMQSQHVIVATEEIAKKEVEEDLQVTESKSPTFLTTVHGKYEYSFSLSILSLINILAIKGLHEAKG